MLEDLLLHDATKRQLATLLSAPPHALLLVGKEHLGKRLIAKAIAAELLGVTRETIENVGMFREIIAQRNTINVESVRGLQAFFSLVVPGNATVKRVVIIPDAEAMTHAAQNSLLKLLEEPPTDAVIVLTSSHPAKLLPTVRSRCQICRIQVPSATDTKTYLHGYGEKEVEAAMLLTEGTIGATKQYLDESNESKLSLQDVKSFLGAPVFEQLLLADTYAKDREIAANFVSMLILVAERGLMATRSSQWQRIIGAALVADEALKKNGNAKLALTELALSLR